MIKSEAPVLREPKQERSRRSFERVQDAALALLVERGPDSFTLAEVCTRADASMGAIYNRVNGKDDLIRLIHEREMARVDSDTEKALRATDVESGRLRDVVAELINRVTVLLRRDADVLRPFMLLAATDQQISVRGRQSAVLMRAQFVELLSQRRDEIRHPDPVTAIEWCFTIVYSVVARRLGLGSTMEGADDAGDWDDIVPNLVDTVTAYLSLAR
ncbi:TetR/AcrR family transcriptional regulator [Nakamurella sp. GG22]